MLAEERECFAVLLEALARSGRSATLRIAGGWVRDRLLGLPCRDLDVVVDRLSGQELAELVAEHVVRAQGVSRERLGLKRNPRQSRHLATGYLRLGELSLEILQLRRERYAPDSRVPAIETDDVTLLEDAARRDFTVNALYFHLGDRIVEDPLCQGWFDLQARVLRTTGDALTSFREDPLRILRGIRFAARLDFALALPWRDIARDPNPAWAEVLDAFERKVAGERAWRELLGGTDESAGNDGCLTGPAPVRVVELLELFGLRRLLFGARPGDGEAAGWTPGDGDLERLDPRPQAILSQRALRDLAADPASTAGVRAAALFAGFPKEHAARLAARILERTRAPGGIARRVVALVAALHGSALTAAWERPAERRALARELGDDLERLLDLGEAVEAARSGVFARSWAPLRAAFAADRERCAARGPFPLTGTDLIALGFAPGPALGDLLRELEQAWFADPGLDREALLVRARERR